jgi:undecaprenyl phosphate N,N'-diacetylbacillosamine 1-phosphate transferase
MRYVIYKRLIDIILSIVILVLVSPIILLAYVLLKASNKSAFFLQKRPGKDAVIFKIIKFKTMNDKRDQFGNLLSDEVRLTPIGKMVRNLSIDELPQLINVLKGDMSLIGPRPLLPEYLPYYSAIQARRHKVRPGITGWAQVNGRNTLTWGKKFEFDVWYVDHLSLLLDIKILWLTILKVLKRDGISSETSATMERFDILSSKS